MEKELLMWEECIKSADKRKPTQDELRIIEYLANKADYKLSFSYFDLIHVFHLSCSIRQIA